MAIRFFPMIRHWILASHPIGSGLITLLFATVANGQLAPEEELKTLLPTPGFEVQLFASEPLIVNPAAIDVDTQGRVWVAEIQLYRVRGKQPASEKIKVLEDTDGDGKADKVTVFADNVVAPMSICVAGDKVYVATSPDCGFLKTKTVISRPMAHLRNCLRALADSMATMPRIAWCSVLIINGGWHTAIAVLTSQALTDRTLSINGVQCSRRAQWNAIRNRGGQFP